MGILEQSVSVRAVPELSVEEAGLQSIFSTKPRPRFAYQWPDNIKVYHIQWITSCHK